MNYAAHLVRLAREPRPGHVVLLTGDVAGFLPREDALDMLVSLDPTPFVLWAFSAVMSRHAPGWWPVLIIEPHKAPHVHCMLVELGGDFRVRGVRRFGAIGAPSREAP